MVMYRSRPLRVPLARPPPLPRLLSQAELSRFVEEKLVMHKRSARSLHLNGSVKSGATSLFGGGGSLVLPTANNAGTIFKASGLSNVRFCFG